MSIRRVGFAVDKNNTSRLLGRSLEAMSIMPQLAMGIRNEMLSLGIVKKRQITTTVLWKMGDSRYLFALSRARSTI